MSSGITGRINPVLAFVALGHALHHIVTALFMTVVLVLTPLWQRPYDELIALWTFGALLLGLGAPLSGWLADRYGARALMVIFYVGLGLASVAAGLSRDPLEMELALAAMGLFGSIYHPVGTAWIVANAHQQGRAIALVGFCGGVGVAAASLVAGGLTDLAGWRSAFIVPGLVMVAVGAVLAIGIVRGAVPERALDIAGAATSGRGSMRSAVVVLMVAMCLHAVAWHAYTTMLPKWLGREVAGLLGPSLASLGLLVGLVYLAGTLSQFVGGHLADRGYLKEVYVASFALKLGALALAMTSAGPAVVPMAILVAFMFDLGSPVENILIARFAPSGRRGLAYGLRHGVAIVAAPLGVQLVAWAYSEEAGFRTLFLALLAITAAILLVALALPPSSRAQSGGIAPARS